METILHGIYSMLHLGEDVNGKFIEQFAQHQELFKQLAVIYESAKVQDLSRDKGYYSHGFAVEQGLDTIENARETEREQQQRMILD